MVLPEAPQGLSSAQARQRLQQDGPNTLRDAQRSPLRRIAREMLQEPMFLLLLASSLLYLLLGDLQEGLILSGLVVIILTLTLYQEGKTARAVAALRELSSPRALVLRDGVPVRVAGTDVVCGDLLILGEGDRIAADAVLVSGNDIQVDESLLTGESLPVPKQPTATDIQACGSHPGSLLYAGTLLVSGHGWARVEATGARSAMGQIGHALDTLTAQESPLKRQTARLVRQLASIALIASLLLVLAYGWTRGDWLGALLAGIALAMALLPQEFTVALTVLPALGAWRLSRQQVLTRRIAAIETLGAASVLCVDKTGTLTENRMTVVQLHVPGTDSSAPQTLPVDYADRAELPEEFHTLVEYSILASVAEPSDPMEKAFHHLGQHFLQGSEHLHRDWQLVHEYALTPALRAMSHVWLATQGQDHVVAAKGAPEAIADLCHLDRDAQLAMAQAVDTMAAQGLRVLGVARAHFAGTQWPAVEHDFAFELLGLLGLADPLRPGIPQAMAQCHSAGIRVLMITGDYPTTAVAIAQQARLAPDGALQVLSGEAMATLSDAELQAQMRQVHICARMAPAQKLRIVQALQAGGAVVAMTGDGVNDAPALKAAHVGIAMGARGTDVAREAAALVLLDDNFASIVGAVHLGRRIFDNLRKSMSYILAAHVPIAGMALLPVLLGWPVMLFPLHIAFLELVIDPACSMVFENEPAEADAMLHPPRDPQAPLFQGMTLVLALLQGLGVLLLTLAAYAWSRNWLAEEAVRAFVFVTLVSGNLALIVNNRSRGSALAALLRVRNPVLWMVVGAALALMLLAVYLPWLARLFFFEPLPLPTLVLALALGGSSLLWLAIVKRYQGWRR